MHLWFRTAGKVEQGKVEKFIHSIYKWCSVAEIVHKSNVNDNDSDDDSGNDDGNNDDVDNDDAGNDEDDIDYETNGYTKRMAADGDVNGRAVYEGNNNTYTHVSVNSM